MKKAPKRERDQRREPNRTPVEVPVTELARVRGGEATAEAFYAWHEDF